MLEGLHKILSDDGTIVAISTPPGHSGIGVVRVSGAKCREIGQRCFDSRSGTHTLEHRVAVIGIWSDSAGNRIDEVVVTYFAAPRSYTGEDVLEISAHGNPFVLRTIVESVIAAGARLANPGEFTLRAVAHGKMDLLQAEALREFVEVQTAAQARTALRQMEGTLSNYIRPIKTTLIDLIARLEAGIDFAEDDVDIPPNGFIAGRILSVHGKLAKLQESFQYGKILVEGLRVAIVGKPNVGKSSLFNCLISADRAIVTDLPGTTRDALSESVSMAGVPLCFVDTAGIRETTDVVEQIGVKKTFEAVGDADFAMVVVDGAAPLDRDDQEALNRVRQLPHVVVVNKNDLPRKIDLMNLNGASRVSISAKTGQGLDQLRATLEAFLLSQKANLNDDLVLTHSRQYDAVIRAVEALAAGAVAARSGVPHEMVLLDLYRGLAALDELTGDVVTDDILERIFSTFCIGK